MTLSAKSGQKLKRPPTEAASHTNPAYRVPPFSLHPALPVPEYLPLLHLYESAMSLGFAEAVNETPTNDAAMRQAKNILASFSIMVPLCCIQYEFYFSVNIVACNPK
jgi:hypothetical protein